MKYLLLIVFIYSCSSFSYQSKNDSKIIASVTDTSNLLNRIAAALYDKGFSLDEKDVDVGFLLTKSKYDQKVDGSRKIRALIKGNTIEFTGLCRVDLSTTKHDEFEPVQNRGMKRGIYKIAWNEMEEIAKQFGTVTYSK